VWIGWHLDVTCIVLVSTVAIHSTNLLLCCAVLCCAVLCCAVLYCAVLCCVVSLSTAGIGMAIGFLFLGQGRASLRRDPLSIGALLLSMSPRFPTRTLGRWVDYIVFLLVLLVLFLLLYIEFLEFIYSIVLASSGWCLYVDVHVCLYL
jgi:hypothetical protein